MSVYQVIRTTLIDTKYDNLKEAVDEATGRVKCNASAGITTKARKYYVVKAVAVVSPLAPEIQVEVDYIDD